MSDNDNFGFGKLIPGFDFLQNLAKGTSQAIPQMPNLSNWVAPTLNLEELEKRITELKAVHFWLDQNSKALGATIQALEVQKMTLATLKGMNFNMGEVANALKFKAPDAAPAAGQKAGAKTDSAQQGKTQPKDAGSGVVDPLQWWGALTQQFQQIAASAMKDSTAQTAVGAAKAAANDARKAPGGRKTPATRPPREKKPA